MPKFNPPPLQYPTCIDVSMYDGIYKSTLTRAELEDVWKWREVNKVARFAIDKLQSLAVGDIVKVIARGESFWCIIEKVETTSFPRVYRVFVDNDLVLTELHGLKADDKILITDYNISDFTYK